ncbi:hypothetical protein SNE40_000568 [Patella caerulea]|uniref:IMS import disulfide relay-system CHCH-CHCH-like Cx9C domain-containing protein n=1 Tax=Patella caerulea TaxID=87958 RepID=A0AAN8KAQ8_PATCE
MEEGCGRYFHNYGRCVEKFPQTWQIDCLQQKLKLNKCADSNPLVVEVKKKCANEFQHYDKCAHKNQDNLDNCIEQFHAFDICAEKIAKKIRSKRSSTSINSTGVS